MRLCRLIKNIKESLSKTSSESQRGEVLEAIDVMLGPLRHPNLRTLAQKGFTTIEVDTGAHITLAY